MRHKEKTQKNELPESAAEYVYKYLREGIVKGMFRPYQRLFEEWVARELNVSRTPVREAFLRLYQEGWLVKDKTRGMVVKGFDEKELEEVIEVRALLEGYVARIIAERKDKKVINSLLHWLHLTEKALKDNDVGRAIELNTSFHELLYRHCGNRVLTKLISQLHDYFYRHRVLLLNLPGMLEVSVNEHKRILDLIKRGKAEQTEKMAREHILRTKQLLKNLMML